MKQESFSDMEYRCRRKKTKREEFLGIMDEIIPWDEWAGIIRPYYPRSLAKAFRQSDEPTLKDAGKKMKWHFWKDKGQLLRDFLGDTANLVTVAPVLVKLGADYGPTLLKILAELVPA